MKEVSLKDVRRVYTEWYCESCRISNEEPVSFSTYMRLMRGMETDIRNIIEMLDAGHLPGFRHREVERTIEPLTNDCDNKEIDGYIQSLKEEVLKGCGINVELFNGRIQDKPTTNDSV